LPEKTERPDFLNIAEITKERVRRVLKKFRDTEDGTLKLETSAKPDYGFRAFKLQSSNFKAWNSGVAKEPAALTQQLEIHVEHTVKDRTQEDQLFEILSKSGFPLSTQVETLTIADKKVYSIEQGAMLVCLDNELTPAVIQAMADRQPVRVICLDAGFAGNDQLKTNAVQQMRARGVTKFQTV
jgi:adenine-specific DNA-methyltransferase